MFRLAKLAKIAERSSLVKACQYRYFEHVNSTNSTGYSKLYHNQQFSFAKYRKPSSSWEKPHTFKRERRVEIIFNVGIWLLVFGLCYSMVPLYKIVCAHMGFDVDYEQKNYNMKGKKCKVLIH